MRTIRLTLAAAVLATLLPTVAEAQQFGGYGTARSTPFYAQRLPAARQAEPHVQYLSVRCAEISEGIRTGPSRGVRGAEISGLRQEYQEKCALDDREARHRVQEDRSRAQQAEVSSRKAVSDRRSAAVASSERCNNMRDTIALRRKREATMNAHEVASLRQFEGTFNAQCLGR